VVVSSGAFDGDDHVEQGMLLLRLTQVFDRGLQVGAVMFDDGGRNQDVAKKSHSIHLERALAQSTLTTPKCSGPTSEPLDE